MTREDVLTYIKTLHGHQRHDQLVALRSLFTWAKRNGLIFRNPTSRIEVGQYEYAVLQPLVPEQVDRRVDGYTDGMVPPRLPVNVGHYEDTFRKGEDTWLLTSRVTHLPFGGETARLSRPGQS